MQYSNNHECGQNFKPLYEEQFSRRNFHNGLQLNNIYAITVRTTIWNLRITSWNLKKYTKIFEKCLRCSLFRRSWFLIQNNSGFGGLVVSGRHVTSTNRDHQPHLLPYDVKCQPLTNCLVLIVLEATSSYCLWRMSWLNELINECLIHHYVWNTHSTAGRLIIHQDGDLFKYTFFF